ncbi:MAG: MBL fold metallo-hydrolase RNA specificity domain-containing protein, partial [Rhodospirillales bacterium]
SQGEPRAALWRIANDCHPRVTLDDGDTVIFSSREIPGNEAAIGRLQNALVRRGIRIVGARDHFVHVSGHPCRDELVRMYQYARPKIAVPVHGEVRHMVKHAALAQECQVPDAIVAENGAMVRLGPGEPGIIDHVPSGRLITDGNRVVPMDGSLQRGRTKAVYNGAAVVTVVLNGSGGLAAEPAVSTLGLLEEGEEAAERAAMVAARDTVEGLAAKERRDDEAVREAVRIAVRRSFRDSVAKRPVTTVHLLRV